MKKNILFLLAVVSIAFSSCKLDDGYSEYIPQILFGNPVKLNSDSSLNFKVSNYSDILRLDSIHVGDTLKLKIGMNAYGNNLVKLTYSVNDSNSIKTILPDSVKKFFKSIDAKSGTFTFNDNYYLAVIPLNLVAVKTSDSIDYKFFVYSNVTKVASSCGIGLRTKIKAKK